MRARGLRYLDCRRGISISCVCVAESLSLSLSLSLNFITRVAPHCVNTLSLSLLLAGRLARARAVAGGRGPPRARAPGPTRGLGTRDCLTARPRARELTELRGTARAPAARGPGRTTRAL